MKKTKQNHGWKTLLLLTLLVPLFTACDSDSISAKDDYKYNLTGMGNASDYVELMQLVNSDLMHGLFGLWVLIAIWAISFMAFIQATQSGVRALAAASYISFIVSIFLMSLEILSPIIMVVMLILAGISTALIKQY